MNNQYILPINIIVNPPDVIKTNVSDTVKDIAVADYFIKKITNGINAFRFTSFYKEENQEDVIKTDSTFLFWNNIAYEREWITFDNLQKNEQQKNENKLVDNEKIEKIINTIFRVTIVKNISIKYKNIFIVEDKYVVSLLDCKNSDKDSVGSYTYTKEEYVLKIEDNSSFLKQKDFDVLDIDNKRFRMFDLLRKNHSKIIKKPTLSHTNNFYFTDIRFLYKNNILIELKNIVQKNNISVLINFVDKINLNCFYSSKFVKIQTDFNLKPYYSEFLITKEIE